MDDKIFEIAAYTLPALITGAVSYFFFNSFVANEDSKRKFLLHRATRKDTLPLKLQAYERMTLFMERISLNKLLLRVPPVSTDKNAYEQYLVSNIEHEFEHNLAQQIYVSEDCWTMILAAKNTTIQMIRAAAARPAVADADGLRESILTDLAERQSPSNSAIGFIKNEVAGIL